MLNHVASYDQISLGRDGRREVRNGPSPLRIALLQTRTSFGNVNSNRCPVGQILQQLESGTTSDIKYRPQIVFVRNFSGKEIDFILPAVRVCRIVEILGRQPMLIAVMDEIVASATDRAQLVIWWEGTQHLRAPARDGSSELSQNTMADSLYH